MTELGMFTSKCWHLLVCSMPLCSMLLSFRYTTCSDIALNISFSVLENLFHLFRSHHISECMYRACLGIIPHAKFTFAKIWIMAAHFEIRQKDLKAARTILGNAIGRAPKDKVLK